MVQKNCWCEHSPKRLTKQKQATETQPETGKYLWLRQRIFMVNLDSTELDRYTKPIASEFNICSTIKRLKRSKPNSGNKH